jgi:elongation factor Ts
MSITPALVKELRERTGAGMMDCKRALVDSDGDIELAAETLRKAGQAKADKRSGRVAAEGLVVIQSDADAGRYAMVEVNSETDFVANDEHFREFADAVGRAVLESAPADMAALLETEADGQTVEAARQELVTKVGENIAVRRFDVLSSEANVGAYSHMGRIGVIVELEGGDPQLARDIAMQVAATSPRFVAPDDVPSEEVAKEREILSAQALQEGKPEHIVEKMVEGRLRKHFEEITLVGQPYVKDPDQRVGQLLEDNKASVKRFIRYEVGEGVQQPAAD